MVALRKAQITVSLAVASITTSSCAIVAGISDYGVVDDARAADGVAPPFGDDGGGGADSSHPPPNVDAGSDAPFVTDAPNNDADATVLAPLCDPNDLTLALCLTFDGNANDGSGGAAVTVPTNILFAPGHIGQGAYFNGASSNVTVPSTARINALATATIEAFVQPSALPTGTARAGIVDSSGRFGLFIVANGFHCSHSSQVYIVNSAKPLVIGKLTHTACVEDGATLIAYQDGVVVGSTAAPSLGASTSATAIGMNEPTGDFFGGMLDEVRIYSRARSPAEIAADSARGR